MCSCGKSSVALDFSRFESIILMAFTLVDVFFGITFFVMCFSIVSSALTSFQCTITREAKESQTELTFFSIKRIIFWTFSNQYYCATFSKWSQSVRLNDEQAIHSTPRRRKKLHEIKWRKKEKIREHRKKLSKTSFWENYLMNAVYNFSLDIQMIVCTLAHIWRIKKTSKREGCIEKKQTLTNALTTSFCWTLLLLVLSYLVA